MQFVIEPSTYERVQDLLWAFNFISGYVFNHQHELSLSFDIGAGEKYTPIDTKASIENHELRYKPNAEWNRLRRPFRKKLHLRYTSNSFFDGWTFRSYFEVKNIFNDLHIVNQSFSDGEVKKSWSSGIFPLGGFMINF